MSELKHTPGPWKARKQSNKYHPDLGWIIEHSNGRIGWASLAYADTNRTAELDDPAREANARLIAAAPELLEACRELLGHCERCLGPTICGGEMTKARAAIEKATS